jgi:hypothetical protein
MTISWDAVRINPNHQQSFIQFPQPHTTCCGAIEVVHDVAYGSLPATAMLQLVVRFALDSGLEGGRSARRLRANQRHSA